MIAFLDFCANLLGYYYRYGEFPGREEVLFTLYKCSMKNGGYQWFLSITPSTKEPGTSEDIDFYYALSKGSECLPPKDWRKMDSNDHYSPSVTCIGPSSSADEDDMISMEDEDGYVARQNVPPIANNRLPVSRHQQQLDSDSDIDYANNLDDSFNSTYSDR